MTGKVLDSGSSGVLILIIPVAVAVVFLYNFWPIILGIAILSLAWTIWQNYQWQQTCIKVNPYFNQLLRENQGCLTPVDLSLKANLSARAATAFLERKSEEYGAQRQLIQDRGVVYYFVTASSLGSIFDDSDFLVKAAEEKAIATPEPKPRLEAGKTPSLKTNPIPTGGDSSTAQPELVTVSSTTSKATSEPSAVSTVREQEAKANDKTESEPQIPLEEIKTALQEEDRNTHQPETPTPEINVSSPSSNCQPLIQSELAKRLEINPSTIGRKRADSDFPQWSQSRDPEGVAWQYVAETRMFVPVDGT
jgi:hypothetical protein